MKLPILTGPCWQVALQSVATYRPTITQRLHALPPNDAQPCEVFDQADRQTISLLLLNCHLQSRDPKPNPLHCRLFDAERTADSDIANASELKLLPECLGSLTDYSFQLYLELLNHLESICFHIHATLWQQRSEELISDLSSTAQRTVDKLEIAQEQHEVLLAGQARAIENHKLLIEDSVKIHDSLATGHASLQSAFGQIQQEVSREHQKVQQIFQDLFDAFSHITRFQNYVKSQIFDLQTCFIYAFLVFLTHYLTSTPRTSGSRAELFVLWTMMAFCELALGRFTAPLLDKIFPALDFLRNHYCPLMDKFDSVTFLHCADRASSMTNPIDEYDHVTKLLIKCLRYTCLSLALVLYFRTFFLYKDPSRRALEEFKSHIENLHNRLETKVLSGLALDPYDPLNKLLVPAKQTNSNATWFKKVLSRPPSATTKESDLDSQKRKYRDLISKCPHLLEAISKERSSEFYEKVQSNALGAKLLAAQEGQAFLSPYY